MNTFPGNLDKAVAGWLEGRGQGLSARSSALSDAYRAGRCSSAVDVAAYMAVRVPATFAACRRVMAEVAALAPGFHPESVLDVGAGPGTATWASLAQWPGLKTATLLEPEDALADVAQHLSGESGIAVLESARLVRQHLQGLDAQERAGLVLASYVLAELPLDRIGQVARDLWQRAGQALVLIEPGTPQGFARIREARDTLIASGAVIAAPCTHGNACPMAGSDWCHFKVRLARSRQHMHAKGATVPFEDEAFSYVVAMRHPLRPSDTSPNKLGESEVFHRVLAPPQVSKVAVRLKLCGPDGLTDRVIPARDRPGYKRAKKLLWGDLL